MSSHHIVREKQEPALLITGMQHFADEQLGQLLEWSPTVLATGQVAEQLESRGIKIDVVIATGDAEAAQPGIKFIRESENGTIFTALSYLLAQGYPAVNIVTDDDGIGGYVAFADQINIVIYCVDQKIYPVASGFSKWKPSGESIKVLNAVPNLTFTGLTQTSPNHFTTTTDGFFSFVFSAPRLFIAETIV